MRSGRRRAPRWRRSCGLRCCGCEAFAEEMAGLRNGVREAQFDRLRSRLVELTEGVPVSEERLLTEAAVLAEKSDIEEEIVRLRTHVDRFVAMLDEGGELGKRLDFLLQELNREANTMLSKTSGAAGENSLRITELGPGDEGRDREVSRAGSESGVAISSRIVRLNIKD